VAHTEQDQQQAAHRLEDCDALEKQLAAAKTKEQVKAVKKTAKSTLEKPPTMAPVSAGFSIFPRGRT